MWKARKKERMIKKWKNNWDIGTYMFGRAYKEQLMFVCFILKVILECFSSWSQKYLTKDEK